jgi:hypothetical protein
MRYTKKVDISKINMNDVLAQACMAFIGGLTAVFIAGILRMLQNEQ